MGKSILIDEFRSYAARALGGDSVVVLDFKGNPDRETALDILTLELGSRLPNFASSRGQLADLRRDLRALTNPTLLLFDTYEQASIEAKNLVENLILPELRSAAALRVVVAGQSVPEHRRAHWADLVRVFKFGPIQDVKHWLKYAGRRYPNVADHQVETLTSATGGAPGQVDTLLLGLVERSGP